MEIADLHVCTDEMKLKQDCFISFSFQLCGQFLACYEDENSIPETKVTFFQFCFRYKITNMCNCYTMPELLFFSHLKSIGWSITENIEF